MSSKSESVPGIIAHAPVVPLRVLFRRFWPYVRPRRRWLPLALVLTMVLPAIEVVDVGLFKVMVDDVLVPRHFELFFRIAMLYLVLALAEAVVSFVADLLSSWLSQRFLLDLRTDVFRHLQTMSLDFYERHRIGDLVSRLTNDIAGIESFLVSGMTAAVSFAVQILLFATVLLVIQWQLALIAMVAAPLFWVVAGRFARRIKTASRERRRRSGSLSALAEETLGNAALIQAYNRQDWEVARFHREGEAKYAAEMSGARLSALYTPVVDMIELLGGLCVIGFGAWLITRSELSIGSFLAFLALLSMLYSPIRGLSRLATSAYSASASAERVIEILDERATVASGPAAQVLARPVEVLNVDDVSFAYPGCAEPTLRNVSLQVRRGDVLALVGSSGAGKSTLIKLLLRFYDPDRGCVRLDGVDVRELELTSLRDNVCVVLQETLVFDGTIRDNIAYGRADATEADIVAAARAADAHEFITSLPEGYDTRVGERGRRLSGGQRQRMAIARAMVRDAPVLVLDEPTTGLDAESGERILEPLRRLMSGRATIVISHNLLTAREATEIVVLDRGKVVERGRHPELLRRHGSYARLYQLSGLALDGREHSPDMGPATATAALGGAGAPDVHTVRATPGGLPGSPARLPGQRHRPRRVVSRAAVPTVIADAVGVVGLRAPSGTTTVNTRSTATGPVAPTLDGIWIVPRGSAAGRLALTGRVPRAPGQATLTGSAFDMMVNGQHAPAAGEPVASAWVSLAIVLAAAGDLRRGATDRRSVADGLVELLWQLPAGWSIAVIDSLGRSVQQPATADVTALVPALSIVSTAPAPDSGLRLGAEQVATALAGRRVVVVVGSGTTTYAGRTSLDASLDATTAGTAVYVASDDVLASGQLLAALGYTGGTAYFTAAADKLAADPTDRYRLALPTPPPTATSAVRLTGIAVGTSSA